MTKKFADKFPFLWILEQFIDFANMLRGQKQPDTVSESNPQLLGIIYVPHRGN